MAISLRGFCRLNISLAKNIFFKPNFISVGVRNLYTDQDLGITTYESTRFVIRNQFLSIEDAFRAKMKDICEDEKGIVYTEDLKAMLHLVRQDDNDFQLLNKMLDKYVHSKDERKFNLYVFGPVAMRAYYYLNQPKYALEAYNNPALTPAFHYRSAFRIMMCLLYKHKMLPELREMYGKYVSVLGREFIGRHAVLLYAGCYIENTPEAFEVALTEWKGMLDESSPPIRGSTILALLAIHVNQPQVALEVISVLDREYITTIKSIKLLAYLHLEKYLQIVAMLKYAIDRHNNVGRKQFFFADVMYEVEEKMNASTVPEKDEILHLISQLKQLDALESRNTLSEFLLRPIAISQGRLDNTGTDAFVKRRGGGGRQSRQPYNTAARVAETL